MVGDAEVTDGTDVTGLVIVAAGLLAIGAAMGIVGVLEVAVLDVTVAVVVVVLAEVLVFALLDSFLSQAVSVVSTIAVANNNLFELNM